MSRLKISRRFRAPLATSCWFLGLAYSSTLKIRWHVSPKRHLIFSWIHGVTTQTLGLFCTYTLDTPPTTHNLERGAVSRFPVKWMDSDDMLTCFWAPSPPRTVMASWYHPGRRGGGVESGNALLVRLMTGCDVWQDNCIATLMCIWCLYVLITVQLRRCRTVLQPYV